MVSFINECITMLKEMAYEKDVLEFKLKNKSETICEHILKCVVYEDSTGDLHYWIKELANHFEYFSAMVVKTSSKKLKRFQYEYLLFLRNGEDSWDIKCALMEFQSNNKKYPQFEITDTLITHLYNVRHEIQIKVCNRLSKKESYSKQYFIDLLYDCFKKFNIEINKGVEIK